MSEIPAWIGAVGTVATLTTGLVLFAITISDRHRGYASLVAVWTEMVKANDLELGDEIKAHIEVRDSHHQGPFSFNLLIKNGSQQPAYDCSIRVRLKGDSLPPGNYPLVYGELTMRLGIIAPETQLPATQLLLGAPVVGHDFREALAGALMFMLVFTDARGYTWTRDQRGRLRRRRSGRPQPPEASDFPSGPPANRND
jgi:hypothetical protein